MSIPARQCTIEIQNKCSVYILCNPHVYTVSGFCEKPLAPTLSPSESGSSLFIKTPHSARGSVGVFTYDLQNTTTKTFGGRIAVMFSVPYDYNLYSNWYGVGVFGLDRQCGQLLFDQMYNDTETSFVRGKAKMPSLTYKGSNVIIRATMSDSYQPVMKVQVCDN
ncbi:uncharacterized protein LOC114846102 [Betta splendens]|uniref:Uncharacterized protein LOC114846102 n=1 Tax=Betta splendens TaxID=158456 RepID=A0A6P7L8B8_BETSP|nr:uncharacterized protein LOC114846102 [Betta splendens]